MSTSIYTPTSDISSGWSLVGGGTHASAVAVDDGDTKYIFRNYNSVGDDVWAGTFDIPIASGSLIGFVRAHFIGRRTNASGDSGGNESRAGLRISGVNYFASVSETWNASSYFEIVHPWVVHPGTGLAWVAADFANLNGIGIRKQFAEVAIGQIRITKSFLEVQWSSPPLSETEISTFWRLHRLVRRKEISETSTDAAVMAKWAWYDELRSRANANGQDLKPPREFTDRDYDAGLFPVRRRFR